MNNTSILLLNILTLDGLYRFLNQQERWQVHCARRKWVESLTALPKKVQLAAKLIQQQKWDPPLLKYQPDRLLYFLDENKVQWVHVNNYYHPIRDEIYKHLKTPK